MCQVLLAVRIYLGTPDTVTVGLVPVSDGQDRFLAPPCKAEGARVALPTLRHQLSATRPGWASRPQAHGGPGYQPAGCRMTGAEALFLDPRAVLMIQTMKSTMAAMNQASQSSHTIVEGIMPAGEQLGQRPWALRMTPYACRPQACARSVGVPRSWLRYRTAPTVGALA